VRTLRLREIRDVRTNIPFVNLASRIHGQSPLLLSHDSAEIGDRIGWRWLLKETARPIHLESWGLSTISDYCRDLIETHYPILLHDRDEKFARTTEKRGRERIAR